MGAVRFRLNRALASGHLPQLRHQRSGRYAIREGVILSAYDIPGPVFNTAAVFEPVASPDRVLTIAREFFGSDRGWSVLVEADAGHPAGHPLEEWLRGWRVINEMPALVMAPILIAPPAPNELQIRQVIDEDGLRDYLTPLSDPVAAPLAADPDEDALVPPNVDELLIRSLEIAQDPDVALFVGYVGGQVAGTAALYRTDGVAEIGGVAVAPALRRRGFGAALTWAAIAEGAARGCDVATLHATELGLPVYVAMGFMPFVVHRRYAPPPHPRRRSSVA